MTGPLSRLLMESTCARTHTHTHSQVIRSFIPPILHILSFSLSNYFLYFCVIQIYTHKHTHSFWQGSFSINNNKTCVCRPPELLFTCGKNYSSQSECNPTRGSQRTSNAGEEMKRWMGVLSPCTSASVCLKRKKGGQVIAERERNPGFWPEDRELNKVTQPRCWLITITIICSKWFGGSGGGLVRTCVCFLVSLSFSLKCFSSV